SDIQIAWQRHRQHRRSRPGRFTCARGGGGADTLECGTTEKAGGIFRARRRGEQPVAQELLRTRQKLLPLNQPRISRSRTNKIRNPGKKIPLQDEKLEAIDGSLNIEASPAAP